MSNEDNLKINILDYISLINPEVNKEPVMVGHTPTTSQEIFKTMAGMARDYKLTVVLPKPILNIPGSSIHFDPFDLILQKQIEEKEHGQFINMQMNILKNRVLKEPTVKPTFQIQMDLNFRKK